MKYSKKTVLALTLLFGELPLLAQVQFNEIHDTSFGALVDIHFHNDQLGIVIEDDYLRMTSDGGKTWRSKFIDGMKARSCGVSVMGTDTLFVLAEAKGHRVSYFHGYHGTPAVLHSRENLTYELNPTICIVDSNIYVAGAYEDTVTMEPAFLVSRDHGHSWTLQTVTNKPFFNPAGGYRLLAQIHQRNADTTLVTWSRGPTNENYLHSFWVDDMRTSVPWRGVIPFSGKMSHSVEGTSLTTVSPRSIRLQRGSDLTSWQELVNDLAEEVRWGAVWLYAKNEFFTLYEGTDIEINAYQFGYDSLGLPTFTDTSHYLLPRSRQVSGGRYAFSQTDHHVYFTVPPTIYRVERQALSQKHNQTFHQKIGIRYADSGNSISIIGLKRNENYSGEIYSLGGKRLVRLESALTAERNKLDLSPLAVGSYLLVLQNQSSGGSAVKKITKFGQ